MKMRILWSVVVAMIVSTLAGCAQPLPLIDKTRFAPPKSVVIVEPPPMRNKALVGFYPLFNPFAQPQHFSSKFDGYFVIDAVAVPQSDSPDRSLDRAVIDSQVQQSVKNQPIGDAVKGIAAAGVVSALIEVSAAETAKKSATFHQDVLARVPDLNLSRDLTQAISTSLQRQGITVSIIKASTASGPRLRWPANGLDGEATVGGGNAETLDADLLIQVSPVAHWLAPGPLNNFRRQANIGVMVYNARTKEYLGAQSFYYESPMWEHEYNRYDSLVADSVVASGAMREALLSLVPQIVNAISVQSTVASR